MSHNGGFGRSPMDSFGSLPPVITFVQFWGNKLCKTEKVEFFNGFKMTGLTLKGNQVGACFGLAGASNKNQNKLHVQSFHLYFLKRKRWWW